MSDAAKTKPQRGLPKGQSLAGIAAAIAIGAGIAWAGSGASINAPGSTWPLFAVCGLVAYLVQWLAFVPSYIAQTEHYYDLTGSLTYITIVVTAFLLGSGDPRAMLLTGLIVFWAVRLGTFLFRRVKADGSDGRFDTIKPDFLQFLMAWSLQALWVFITASAALAAITSSQPVELGWVAALGFLMWVAGFAFEVIADYQKRVFRADPVNDGQFIESGLWSWSRHPNYFGEILLWAGIAVIALPALSGWQYVTLISPIFVYVLLTRISGIPMLERRARRRWGSDPAWQAYMSATSQLVPKPPANKQT